MSMSELGPAIEGPPPAEGAAPAPPAPGAQTEASAAAQRPELSRRLAARSAAMSAEVAIAFGAAALITYGARSIAVNPLDRVGQVSALASIGLEFTLLGLLLVAVLCVAARVRGGLAFELTSRLVCAALAGLASGFVAAGVVVALRGTPWCLNATHGDAGRLAKWAAATLRGQAVPPYYPPLPVHTIALYSNWFQLPAPYAFKHLEILGTLSVGPLVYASWRLIASPLWALGIGVVAALPLIDPYKPYANLVLCVMLPVLVSLFGWLRRAGDVPVKRLVPLGAAYGLGLGALCLTYFGWFQWSAPGALVAGLLLFPWRGAQARARGASLLGAALLVFSAVAGPFLWRAFRVDFKDDFFYFDTHTDPAYFAMWLWDLPGPVGPWPPPGELGGVGLFSLLVAVGIGLAVALGQRRVLVTTLGCVLAGAWVLRFWFAQRMWETGLVQLYPRTSIEILHCSLVLSGYAVYLLAERFGERAAPKPAPSHRIGVVCALLLVLGSAGSALADRYMPADEKPASLRSLAWYAHRAPH